MYKSEERKREINATTEMMCGNAKTKENRTLFVIQSRRFRAILASGFGPTCAMIYLFLILPRTNPPIFFFHFSSLPVPSSLDFHLKLLYLFSPHITISLVVFPVACFLTGTCPALCAVRDSGFDKHVRLGYLIHKSSLDLSTPRLPVFFHQLFDSASYVIDRRNNVLYNYVLNFSR